MKRHGIFTLPQMAVLFKDSGVRVEFPYFEKW
jgi:hypothetical protein